MSRRRGFPRRRAGSVDTGDAPSMAKHSFGDIRDIEGVRKELQSRHDSYYNYHANNVADLGLGWQDQSPNHPESAYYAHIDGKQLPLSENALKQICKMVKSTPEMWDQASDKDAMPKFVRHVLDNKPSFDGLALRHDGYKVRAILPRDYQVKDASELLDEILEPIQENVGDIQGISLVDESSGDISSIRIVAGTNLMPSLQNSFGQYFMYLINTSDTGAIDTQTVLGLWRSICSNSAIKEEQMARWDHRNNYDGFWNRSMDVIRQFSYFKPQITSLFEELTKARLEVDPYAILNEMRRKKLITNSHFDMAKFWLKVPTEDHREIETQYDLYNVLTRAAQDLPSLASQHKAELAAMKIFTEPGGIVARLQEGAKNNPVSDNEDAE